ncbi:MAG TPA: GTP-binding protein [Bryobacteraceae bacterium]|jgi:sulfate adenylyltransferase large subunit|nr:GTP-binding protein [Bryobacteraceae bacterium]
MTAVEERFDVEQFLAQEISKDLLRFTTAGSVDDGKSTLIGRLLHDARGAYEDQLHSVRRGNGEIDFALLTDGLQAEREQGITIDVAYRYFATPRRKFILADTPGHEQYTRNMATGASTADLAIVLLDASRGLTAQSHRHASITALLGIRHVVVAVNKMDLVGYDQQEFFRLRHEFAPVLEQLGVRDPYFLPISALKGDNVVESSRNMPWFVGRPLLEHLESVEAASVDVNAPFRFPVQRVSRPDSNFRGYAGQVASGSIRPGDEVLVLPSNRRTRVRRIATFDGDLELAHAPLSVTLTLDDEIDISRGDVIVAGDPPQATRAFDATLVWFDGEPLNPNREYLLKHTTQTIRAKVAADRTLAMNDIGNAHITTAKPLFVDPYKQNRITGSVILIDRESNATVAAGLCGNGPSARSVGFSQGLGI